MTECFFKDRMNRECSGPADLHHFVKQQTIRKRFPFGAVQTTSGLWPTPRHFEPHVELDAILGDERNMVAVCREHHELWHNRRFPFLLGDLPPEAIEFAEEYGLLWALERQYDVPLDQSLSDV